MLKLLKQMTKKDWLLVFICFIFIIFQVWLDLKLPDYMSTITTLVQTEGSEMSDILLNGGYMLLCAFGSLLAAIITGYFVARVAASFSKNLRQKIFRKVGDFSLQEIKNFSTSSLITRTTNDVTQIEMLIAMGMQMLIKAPITAVWAISKILNKSWQWSAVTGVAVVILLSVIGTLITIILPKFKIVQKLIDKINGLTRENLTGIRVVRAFNAEKFQEEKFEETNNSLTNLQLSNQKKLAILQPVMYLVMYGLTLSIYFIGAHLIANSVLADKLPLFSDMVVFSSYAMQVIMSFLMLAMIFMIVPRASVSAKRINEILDEKVFIKDPEGEGAKPREEGTIAFKNVSFKYPDADEYILKNISFEVKKGETVAFLGSTGSGKSTLLNLIPRFYDATEGTVYVDGVDVKEYKQEDLHNLLGYVSQRAVMFKGTIASNVSYGKGKKKITKEKIKDAVHVAQADDFVLKLEGTYDHAISQGGTNVSGGQKQRLSIARAIARDPEIYLFDDSFSALDYKTDATLRKELKKYTKDATTLIVAQRIGTVMNADKILVLDNGECVGMGTHKELLKNCEVYKQIALSQLSKEELDHA